MGWDTNMKTRINPAPPGASSRTTTRTGLMALVLFAIGACGFVGTIHGAEQPVPAGSLPTFEGGKTAWHGFDRYDFQMDEESLAIQPIKAADDEKDGIKHGVKGQRRCVVVVPKAVALGNPWSWRGCYWDHQPQTEVELLKRVVEKRYKELGGQITVIVKEGEGHFPTAPKDPKPVVDFITARTQ